MSLIESFGYDAVKDMLKEAEGRDHKYAQLFEVPALRRELLEYRRDKGIFEIGDKVMFKGVVYTYESYSVNLDLHFFESAHTYGHLSLDKVRHLTDEELKNDF